MMRIYFIIVVLVAVSCGPKDEVRKPIKQVTVEQNNSDMLKKLNKYVVVKLDTDISVLTDNEKKMLLLLIKAADKMNDLFWFESYGDSEELLNSIEDVNTKKYAEINYGPWDRLEGNAPFVEGVLDKPLGAIFTLSI
tara:strand:- start:143 stop:553 length:411 start_codon:yes stop_codon:yes gene_type:complete